MYVKAVGVVDRGLFESEQQYSGVGDLGSKCRRNLRKGIVVLRCPEGARPSRPQKQSGSRCKVGAHPVLIDRLERLQRSDVDNCGGADQIHERKVGNGRTVRYHMQGSVNVIPTCTTASLVVPMIVSARV